MSLRNLAGAHAELRKCSVLLESLGAVREMVYVMHVLAQLLHATGRASDAARILGASDAMCANAGMSLLPWEQRELDELTELLAADMGREAVALSKQAGALLSLDQSLAEVKSLLDSVKLG